MGRFWRRYNNIIFFKDLESYLRDHGAPLSLLLVSSGLVVAGTFGVHLEPALAPVLSVGVLGLASNEASGFAGYYGESDLVYLYSFHSLVVGKVAVLLVAVIKVVSTRDAFIIVALLEVVVNLVT